MVVPSQEDNQTFSILFTSGDVFKLRSTDWEDRQRWLERLREAVKHQDAEIATGQDRNTSIRNGFHEIFGSNYITVPI